MDKLIPKDHAEAVAIFCTEVVGALVRRELDRGELRQALRSISLQKYRPPGLDSTKTLSIPTLEHWCYAYKAGGLAALRPSRAATAAAPRT